jgi:hypothetical protein
MAQFPPQVFGSGKPLPAGMRASRRSSFGTPAPHRHAYSAAQKGGIEAALAAAGVQTRGVRMSFVRVPRGG